MTIPNAIPILRILLVPPFVIVLLRGHYGGALGIFVLAAISDAVDGYIARRYRQKSRIGAFLDPLADKLLAGTAFILLALRHVIPDWLAVVVVSREFVILFGLFLLTVVNAPIRIAPSRMGKLNTFFQLVTICLCLLANMSALSFPPAFDTALAALFAATGATTAISGLQYLFRGLRQMA
jgi:cardiolipin synthase